MLHVICCIKWVRNSCCRKRLPNTVWWGQWSPETPLAELFYTYLLNCLFNWWTQIQQILTSPRPTGGGDATPDDSGADAYVRLAGRTSSTQLTLYFSVVVHILYTFSVGENITRPIRHIDFSIVMFIHIFGLVQYSDWRHSRRPLRLSQSCIKPELWDNIHIISRIWCKECGGQGLSGNRFMQKPWSKILRPLPCNALLKFVGTKEKNT